MKIHELPMGARFAWQGRAYVKSGPLFADGEDGRRMIPRHAVLQPLDPVPVAAPTWPANIPAEAVCAGVDALLADCRQLPGEHYAQLQAACDRLLDRLGLSGRKNCSPGVD
jgi:hypothetical protein